MLFNNIPLNKHKTEDTQTHAHNIVKPSNTFKI